MKVAILIALCGVAHADALEPDDLAPPAGEHGPKAQIDLPPVPAFTLSQPSDGSHSVRELRVRGARLLDTKLTVRGVITWVYDCKTAVRTAGESDRAVGKRIDDDPTLCERAKFYVGDTAQTPVEKSLWVVDVPRPYNKLELERIKKSERTMPDRCEPGEKHSVCPPYRVGDVVVVTGDFKISSPHSERNSDGLLVLAAMRNATQKWETPGSAWTEPGASIDLAPPISHTQPAVPAVPATPMRQKIDKKAHDESLASLRTANRAFGSKQYADAIAGYQQAVVSWHGNHVAWYGLGAANAAQGQWKEASTAFMECLLLREDVAMYQMWYGISLYETAVMQARAEQAQQQGRRPEDVTPDLTAINFERALQHELTALKLDPGLWRAQYYRGRMERAQGHAHEAADAFARALQLHPREPAPYVALAELYRRWDYTDEAIKVAMQGTQNAIDLSDLWYVLGMAYDDKRLDARAIEAFTKALDVSPTNAKARFQRGQAYFRSRDRANAKADLEDFLKTAPASLEFAKQQASAMLMDFAAKH